MPKTVPIEYSKKQWTIHRLGPDNGDQSVFCMHVPRKLSAKIYQALQKIDPDKYKEWNKSYGGDASTDTMSPAKLNTALNFLGFYPNSCQNWADNDGWQDGYLVRMKAKDIKTMNALIESQNLGIELNEEPIDNMTDVNRSENEMIANGKIRVYQTGEIIERTDKTTGVTSRVTWIFDREVELTGPKGATTDRKVSEATVTTPVTRLDTSEASWKKGR